MTTRSDTDAIRNEKLSQQSVTCSSKIFHEDCNYGTISASFQSCKLIGKDMLLMDKNVNKITVNAKVKPECLRKKKTVYRFDNKKLECSKFSHFHEILYEKHLLTKKIQDFEKKLCYRTKLLGAAKYQDINLRTTISCLQNEIQTYRAIYSEQDKLKNENIHFEKLKNELQYLQYLKEKGNILKNMYGDSKSVEDEFKRLQLQVVKAEFIKDDGRMLKTRIHELEACILEQENEIHRLLSHIDHLVNGTVNC